MMMFALLHNILKPKMPFSSCNKSLLMVYSFLKEPCSLLHQYISTFFILMPHISLVLMVLLRFSNNFLFFLSLNGGPP
jgi:hypothetical protein